MDMYPMAEPISPREEEDDEDLMLSKARELFKSNKELSKSNKELADERRTESSAFTSIAPDLAVEHHPDPYTPSFEPNLIFSTPLDA
ncbi:hypothetical protein Q3G72_019156 [Acer saccharum]|nr:hypothetical protein Q3G72_019156 [Acer saccharum]